MSMLATEAARPQVSVVLPCLNEAGSVALVVREALEAIGAAGYTGEVVIGDNGSTDGSQAIAEAAGARVVHQPIRGYGAALAAGINAARGVIVVMADADNTYPFEFLGRLVAPVLADEVDMMIGARWSGATAHTMPFLHRFVGTPVLTWLVRRAGGPAGLTDSQSGFRAFRRDRLLDLHLRSTGMDYASEMFIVAGRQDWRIREIPAGYRERIGESKLDTLADGWRHLKTIVLLAPDLLATYPGAAAFLAGVLMLGFSFLNRGAFAIGSLGWLGSLLGPVFIIIGVQAVLAGVVIGVASPLRRHSRTERFLTDEEVLRSAAIGGLWLVGVALVLDLTLFLSWALRLGAPFVGLPLAGLAQAMLLIGLTLIWYGVIASILLAGSRRWGAGDAPSTADAVMPRRSADAILPVPIDAWDSTASPAAGS